MVQMSKKELFFYGAGAIALAIGLMFAGSKVFNIQDSNQDAQVFDGQFAQIGLAEANMEEPFVGLNGFETITVDNTANAQDELDGASFKWKVENGTSLALEERTAVIYHEVEDGGLENVEYTLQQGANYSDLDAIQRADVYDYEAAVDNGQLGRALVSLEIDSTDKTADNSDQKINLQDGEYALVVGYKFDSDASVPGTAGNTLELNTLEVSADSDDSDAVETITGVPIEVEAK